MSMVLYNVTIKVDPSIAREWINWLNEEHIPDILATGCFTNAKVFHLLEQEESDGITYCVQYEALNKSDYEKYISTYATEMRKKATEKWNNQFIAFRSVLELVH